MRRQILARGKSVQQAVAAALDLLSADKNEVDIEILENESKGLFGLGTKPAVVRVSVKDQGAGQAKPSPTRQTLEEALDALNLSQANPATAATETDLRPDLPANSDDRMGKLWISDGKIFCQDAPDKYPILAPGRGLQLYKNEELVQNAVVASEKDVFRVELAEEVQNPKWELTISENKLEATLKVVPGKRVTRTIKDKAPSHFVLLEVEEEQTPIKIETAQVMDKLAEMGIVHGIDFNEIARACASDEAGSFVIAKGTPPVPGKHGYFQPIQQIDIKKGLKERSDGTVDYREIQEFPSVDRGQVIGIVFPPEQGLPGRTVTDEFLFPPDVFPLTIAAGKGVSVVDNGTKIIATDAGHPEVVIKGQMAQISVNPKLLIGKDVDLGTGNVHYIGNVEILGSVQDGMTVEVQGHLLIRQNVNMAKISAESSIIVQHNIITSDVSVGKSKMILAEISEALEELVEQLKQMNVAINQLTMVSAFKVSSITQTGLGPLIKILCDGKFQALPPLVKSIIQKIKSGIDVLDKTWAEFGLRLHKGLIALHSSNIRSPDDLADLIRTAQELQVSTLEAAEKNRFVRADIVHNSVIYSLGDILVTGQGVYHSRLYAGGVIEVDGIVRGGEIYASKGVIIGNAGTKGGGVTKIAVSQEGSIKIKTAGEDTLIQVGNRKHAFTSRAVNVHARLDKSGELKLD